MTVEENLKVGELIGPSRKPRTELVYEYFPMLQEKRRQWPEICRAVSSSSWRSDARWLASLTLLLLDEPSEGIQPSVVQAICRVLRPIRDSLGTTILLVEQNMDTIVSLAERCYVMEKGQTLAEIPHGQVTTECVRRHLLL